MPAQWKFLLALLCLMVFPALVAGGSPPHAVRMYHTKPFTVEQVRFYPSDTVYAVLEFREIPAGEYTITADWILPSGKIIKQDVSSFSLEKKVEIYQVPFWLKIHAKGPMGQMFSGSEYNQAVFGRWIVRMYCNGEVLSETPFEVTDSVI